MAFTHHIKQRGTVYGLILANVVALCGIVWLLQGRSGQTQPLPASVPTQLAHFSDIVTHPLIQDVQQAGYTRLALLFFNGEGALEEARQYMEQAQTYAVGKQLSAKTALVVVLNDAETATVLATDFRETSPLKIKAWYDADDTLYRACAVCSRSTAWLDLKGQQIEETYIFVVNPYTLVEELERVYVAHEQN